MIYYNDIIFSKEECNDILNSANDFTQSVVGVNYNNELYDLVANTNKRKSTQSEMVATPDSFIYKKINEIINTFDYKLICDEFHYDVIKYKESDFVWRHRDENDVRMFTIVVQLNEEDSYDGGEFKYWLDDTEYQMDKQIGHGIAFKASVFHEVKPVISNERHSFVSFVKFSDVKKIGKSVLI
jgi:predicted 2-oxoglutarate/Fe(II)-dependent dioxygenase YbiX